MFLRLVTFTDDGEDTRRRVLQSELEDLDVDRQLLRSVLDTFGRHRLLSFDRDPISRSPTVEISHEALLDGVDTAARLDRRRAQRRPDAAAARRGAPRVGRRRSRRCLSPAWRASSSRSPDGPATTSLQLSGPERTFLDASVAERDREEEETLQRENRAAVAERRQRQRGRQLLDRRSRGRYSWRCSAVFGPCSGVRRSTPTATSTTCSWSTDLVDRLAAHALDDDPELALLLAMQSLRRDRRPRIRHRGGGRRSPLRAARARGASTTSTTTLRLPSDRAPTVIPLPVAGLVTLSSSPVTLTVRFDSAPA